MIHSSSDAEGVRAKEMEGMAKLSTVLSTETSKTGSISTARAIQERAPARGVLSGELFLSVVCVSAMTTILYRPDGLLYRLDG